MKDYAKAFIYKYRRVYAILYVPTLILMLAVYSVLPNIHVKAQSPTPEQVPSVNPPITSEKTDWLGDVNLPQDVASINENNFTVRWINAITVEINFPSAPDKHIVFTLNKGFDQLVKWDENGRQGDFTQSGRRCTGKFHVFSTKLDEIEDVDLDFAVLENGGCQSVDKFTIHSVDTTGSTAYFRWIDSGQIRRVDNDGSWNFTAETVGSQTVFRRDSEANQKCQDFIVVEGDAMKLFEVSDQGAQHSEGIPDEYKLLTDPGCKYAVHTTGHPAPNNKLIPFEEDTKANKALGAGTGSTSGNIDGEENPTCETSGGSNPLSYIICPVFNMLVDAVDALFRVFIDPLMRFSPIDVNNESDVTVQIWSSFRFIANLMLVAGLIIAIFGQSIGGGVIDAYTAKKMLPRILLAAIFVNLSIYFVAIMVDITNVLGKGVGQLLTAPLNGNGNFHFEVTGADTGVSTAAFIGGGLVVLGFLATLFSTATLGTGTAMTKVSGISAVITKVWTFVLFPAVLITLAIVATLVIRRGLIILLAVVSPVAGALYVLPSTEKYFKTWWENFFKTLMMYPIISAIFAVADILFVTLRGGQASAGGGAANTVGDLVASAASFVILFVPLALVPFSFKFAGALMGNIYNLAKSGSDRARARFAGNEKDPMSRRNRAQRRYDAAKIQGRKNLLGRGDKLLESMANYGAGTDKDGNKIAPQGGRLRRRASSVARSVAGSGVAKGAAHRIMTAAALVDRTRLDWDEAQLNKMEGDIRNELSGNGNDRLLRASQAVQATLEDVQSGEGIGGNTDIKEGHWYSAVNGAEFSYGDVAESKKYQRGNQAAGQAALFYEYKKANDEEMARLVDVLPQWLENTGYGSKDMGNNVLIGAGFAIQGQRREAKHFRTEKGDDGHLKLTFKGSAFSKEMYEKMGTYESSKLDASSARRMGDVYDDAVELEANTGEMTSELHNISTDETLSETQRLADMEKLATDRVDTLTKGSAEHKVASRMLKQINTIRKSGVGETQQISAISSALSTQSHVRDIAHVKGWADGLEDKFNRSGTYGEVDGVPIAAGASGGAGLSAEIISAVVQRTRPGATSNITSLIQAGRELTAGGTALPGGQVRVAGGGGSGGGGGNGPTVPLRVVGGGPAATPVSRPGQTVRFTAPVDIRPRFTPATFTTYTATQADVNSRRIDPKTGLSVRVGDVVDFNYTATPQDVIAKREDKITGQPMVAGQQYIEDTDRFYQVVANLGGVQAAQGQRYTLKEAQSAIQKLPTDVLQKLQADAPLPQVKTIIQSTLNSRERALGRAEVTVENIRGAGTDPSKGPITELIVPAGTGTPGSTRPSPTNIEVQQMREFANREVNRVRAQGPPPKTQLQSSAIPVIFQTVANAGGKSRGGAPGSVYNLADAQSAVKGLPNEFLERFTEATKDAHLLPGYTVAEQRQLDALNTALNAEAADRVAKQADRDSKTRFMAR